MATESHVDGATIDPAEIERFARLAADWWNPNGSMRALHRLNPLRLAYLRRRIAERFERSPDALDGLSGLTLCDIGCGAGLLAEPLARLGARVTAIDATAEVIEAARLHAEREKLDIDYRASSVEALLAEERRYDVVTAMEVIEHVAEREAFVAACAGLLEPGGLLVLSTINRTLRAYALAIVGAEYVLGWLPRGTHRWEKFVMPEEIEALAAKAGLARIDLSGVVYSPFGDEWRLSRDTAVNYMIALGG